ncbi:transporter [Weizmannia acidilactici]|uniref:Transporter n=1 Tax=Weizmannia acidilactici TaxID=2607726 RepID=A0A5J4JFL7_9BACI|nr:polysaccharide biosynthesis protein [Weizmannia acidilactici]GER66469.1 transporter [Weizmannia acidilactici]GER69385.1 transporter [Weizmannia acidilactici]GER72287.1 transporter [Weizmannia acidilactici]
MSSNLLRGTFILTLGTIISKILGVFYVIPFDAIVGGSGPEALYQFGYVPYNIFISISTAGVPLAVAKYVAKYNALEEYAVSRKLFRTSVYLMLATGILGFLVMYIFAPYFTDLAMAGKQDAQAFTKADVTTVIRAVSFALIIIPVMSLIRGFFQGHQSMGPSAVSQVVEQFVRILFMLIGAYVILHVLHGSIVSAISAATFAAFVGGIASLLILIWYWVKRKPHLDRLLKQDRGTMHVSVFSMYKEIILSALPFVFVGIANSLYQMIDQLTVKRGMEAINLGKVWETQLGILNFQSHKLVIIPVSLATAFSMTLVPMITEAFAKRQRDMLIRSVDQTLQVLLFITVPAALGMSLLARPIFAIFYNTDNAISVSVLMHYAPVAILFSLYSVTAAIMQGINEQRWTILSLLVGLLFKLSLNIPLIKMYGIIGAVYATAIGYMASILISFIVIKVFAAYPYRTVIRRTILILIFNAVMLAVVGVIYKGLTLAISPSSRWHAFLIVVICALAGAAVYAYLGLKSRLADKLFGVRVQRVKALLHMR